VIRAISFGLACAIAACGTTGGELVTFEVAAAGPPTASGPGFAFDNGFGWHIVLDKAQLHMGAIYLNLTVPSSGSQFTNCILPGVYTAQQLSGLTVDALSATPQPFPTPGTGTNDAAKAAEVWLTGGDVNAATDRTVIADIAGTASSGDTVIPFTASVTIGGNRLVPTGDPSQPSMHPICKQRIVSPIIVDDLRPIEGGTLLVRLSPAAWFSNVDFTGLAPGVAFPDDLSIPQSQNLFSGLHSSGSAYTFTFESRSSP
jgi:hypothetical protein